MSGGWKTRENEKAQDASVLFYITIEMAMWLDSDSFSLAGPCGFFATCCPHPPLLIHSNF